MGSSNLSTRARGSLRDGPEQEIAAKRRKKHKTERDKGLFADFASFCGHSFPHCDDFRCLPERGPRQELLRPTRYTLHMALLSTSFCRDIGIEVPLLCGAMYPCSNPELVAAVSEAGGLGIVQPLSLTYVHGHEFRQGLRFIRELTAKPIGLNVIVEDSSKIYLERMRGYVEEALDEGVRFFVTALGKPGWVVEMVHTAGGRVYHNVTEAKWAQKAIAEGVDGLIAVNDRAGGHAGPRAPHELFDELAGFGKPVLCAGGIGDEKSFVEALGLGYAGVQLGTRFITTKECTASEAYKQAIVDASESDIVLTERITGVPVSVIRTPYLERIGTKAGPVARFLLRGRRTRRWMRALYSVRSGMKLKKAHGQGGSMSSRDFLQAGKSVATISEIESVADIVARFRDAAS